MMERWVTELLHLEGYMLFLRCCSCKLIVLLSDNTCNAQSRRGACSLSAFGLSCGKTERCWWATVFLWGTAVVSAKASVCKVCNDFSSC